MRSGSRYIRPFECNWARSSLVMASNGSGTAGDFQVGGKYRLVRKIGSGSFGDIYLGVNVSNGEVRIEDEDEWYLDVKLLQSKLSIFVRDES